MKSVNVLNCVALQLRG